MPSMVTLVALSLFNLNSETLKYVLHVLFDTSSNSRVDRYIIIDILSRVDRYIIIDILSRVDRYIIIDIL